MQQLQVRENMVGFEKALGAAKATKDQIQYRSQNLLNLARDHFAINNTTNTLFQNQKAVYVGMHHDVGDLSYDNDS